jgi:uncharacterized membrane protein
MVDIPSLNTWIIFYLISFVMLLWAIFLTAKGVMLWVSLMLVIIVTGISFALVYQEVRKNMSRREIQKAISSVTGEKK